MNYTKAQPIVEDAHTWRCIPDMWTNLQDWICEHRFAFWKFTTRRFVYRGLTVYVFFMSTKMVFYIHGNQGGLLKRQCRMRNKIKRKRREEVSLSWRSQKDRREVRSVMMQWKPGTERISVIGWGVLSGVSDKMGNKMFSIWSNPILLKGCCWSAKDFWILGLQRRRIQSGARDEAWLLRSFV